MGDRRNTARRLAATLALAVLGCRGADQGGETATLPRWSIEETLRIGATDDPTQSLTRVLGPVVGRDGRVFVGQPGEGLVRIFDATGRFVATAGGAGEGPGEFRHMVAIGLLGDSLYGMDFQGRIAFFSLDGRYLSDVTVRPVTESAQALPVLPVRILPDGSIMAAQTTVAGSDAPLVVLHLSRDGQVLDTLFTGPTGRVGRSDGALRYDIPVPFPAQPLLVVDEWRGRTAIIERPTAEATEDARFRVTVRSAEGATLYQRDYSYSPVAIESDEADSAVARSARTLSRIEPDPAKARAIVRSAAPTPRFHPPVRRALFAEDGRLWLEQGGPDRGPRSWIVHADEGTPVAVVEVPGDAEVRAIGADDLWAVETDALDVPYVVRYRISPADAR